MRIDREQRPKAGFGQLIGQVGGRIARFGKDDKLACFVALRFKELGFKSMDKLVELWIDISELFPFFDKFIEQIGVVSQSLRNSGRKSFGSAIVIVGSISAASPTSLRSSSSRSSRM